MGENKFETTFEVSSEEVIEVSVHDFYFEIPLYSSVNVNSLNSNIFSGDVDAYSSKNSIDTTYNISSENIRVFSKYVPGEGQVVYSQYKIVSLECKRKSNDLLHFFVFVDNDTDTVTKVGQFPALAELQFAEIGKKYDKILPKEELKNLKKAIGLASHDAGAGSFVYLRRIFENLISETYENNVTELGVAEADFKKNRMEDKVEIIKEFLPSQLVEMRAIYRILSKGVHELTEEECRRYFNPLKFSIELILDQRIDNQKKQKRNEEVKKQLQDIHQEISKSSNDKI